MTGVYLAQALIAPKKSVHGRGVLSSLGRYVEELGQDALVIADRRGPVREAVEPSLAEAGVRSSFDGRREQRV